MKSYTRVALFSLVFICLYGCNKPLDNKELSDLKLCRYAANYFGGNQEISVLDQKLSDYWDKFKDVRDPEQIQKINDIDRNADAEIEKIREQIDRQKNSVAKDELEKRYHSVTCTALIGS